ncbi:hypothetical protein [Streptomyces sp. 5-10]|uniref:hypothetical protein n=1 Tax=Streptomyces sp. 5-10 TaxID=878925 RepID=UPI00168B51F4|nr:hypothetical protein [Streptomyces sp. 5-10]
MPTKTEYPMRVRLHGGRNTHGARETINTGAETACDTFVDILAENHWLDDDAKVTCKRCVQVMGG